MDLAVQINSQLLPCQIYYFIWDPSDPPRASWWISGETHRTHQGQAGESQGRPFRPYGPSQGKLVNPKGEGIGGVREGNSDACGLLKFSTIIFRILDDILPGVQENMSYLSGDK